MSLNHEVNINRHGIGGDWKPLGFLAVVAGGTVFGKCTWKEECAEAFSIPKTVMKPYEVESRNNEKTVNIFVGRSMYGTASICQCWRSKFGFFRR